MTEVGDGLCDFCRRPDLKWVYPADDFDMEEFGWGSVGAWAACETCSSMIEGHDYRALATRTLAAEPGGYVKPHPKVWQSLLEMHREFRRHRIGDRMTLDQARKEKVI